MSDTLAGKLLELLPVSLIVILGIAALIYVIFRSLEAHHLASDKRTDISLWLMGEYGSTWATEFCRVFDVLFTSDHFTKKCFYRSIILSISSVAVLFLLFIQTESFFSTEGRTGQNLSFLSAIGLAFFFNIIPDYLSLYETRWILYRFKHIKSFFGQLLVLMADLIITALIVWLPIFFYTYINSGTGITVPQMAAGFTIYSLFFYSTFITSIWAWLFCISTWLMRLFSETFLSEWLDVENKPLTQVGLVIAILLIPILFFTKAVFYNDKNPVNIDDFWCGYFDSNIMDCYRLSASEKKSFEYLEKICAGIDMPLCMEKAFSYFDGDKKKAFSLWHKACDGGHMRGCNNLGFLYSNGDGIEQDTEKAFSYYQRACDGGDMDGCKNLGVSYHNGDGIEQDTEKAISYYQQACDGGDLRGCMNIGTIHFRGDDIEQDTEKAFSYYQQVCDGGYMHGCINLGFLYSKGDGIEQDTEKAISYYQQACDAGYMRGCINLGFLYSKGDGIEQDTEKAISYYQQACDAGDMGGCAGLGFLYSRGDGIELDAKKAISYYQQACDAGIKAACKAVQNQQ